MHNLNRHNDYHLLLNDNEVRKLKLKAQEMNCSSADFLRKCINLKIAFLDANLTNVLNLFSLNPINGNDNSKLKSKNHKVFRG